MSHQKIEAHRVTKPIQLLAAWLIGLVLVDGIFLGAAASLGSSWERSLLIVAAVMNVPGFLLAIFLLQTKFRPELQEDVFYSEYISKKTSSTLEVSKVDFLENAISDLRIKVESRLDNGSHGERLLATPSAVWRNWKVGLNVNLPFYEGIKARLQEAGIPIFTDFGDTAVTKLTSYNVSISYEVDPESALVLLKVVSEFPINKFEFWHPIQEAGENEDVYIGSYGSEEDAVTLTSNVREAIASARDRADLLRIRGL